MDELAAELALDPAALREKVHEAQEGERDDKGEEGGEIGVHVIILIDVYL